MAPVRWRICCSLAILLQACVVSITANTVTVSTQLGDVNGMSANAIFNGETKPFSKFLGIPFSEPPVGEYRFAKPRPISAFPESPYNATFNRSPCPYNQHFDPRPPPADFSEDCLHLNVYVPGSGIDGTKQYAVMVWIYGGGFVAGQSYDYSPDVLSAFHDVIIVTFNYRLSVFGFLTSGDASYPGNYGLWDQHMAIKWVYDNIASFGGAQDNISLFGESAGGAAVIYQSVYRGNEGLIRRSIAQSGTSMSPWAYQRDAPENFWALAKSVGCVSLNKANAVECLRNISVSDLMAAMPVEDNFVPFPDGNFVRLKPSVYFGDEASEESKRFRKLDLLMGVNNKEGMMDLLGEFTPDGMVYRDLTNGMQRSTMVDVVIPFGLKWMEQKDNAILKEAIIHQYSDWSDPESNISVRNHMIDFVSDSQFFYPTLLTLKAHTSNSGSGSTFFYEFTHKLSYDSVVSPAWLDGANHADEIPFVFGFAPYGTVFITTEEKVLTSDMMKLWTDFAKFGDPNTNNVLTYEWPQYDQNETQLLEISTNMASPQSVRTSLAPERMAFWQYLVPSLLTCESVCQDCGGGGDTETSSAETLSARFAMMLLFASLTAMFVNKLQ